MTNPSPKKRVVTVGDLNTLNANSAYAYTQGEVAKAAAAQATTAAGAADEARANLDATITGAAQAAAQGVTAITTENVGLLRQGVLAEVADLQAATLAALPSTSPRPLTPIKGRTRVLTAPFTADLPVLSGQATPTATGLLVDSDARFQKAGGVLGAELVSEGVQRLKVKRDAPRIAYQWGVTGKTGKRFAIWLSGGELEIGWWTIRDPDQALIDATPVTTCPVPDTDFYVEVARGPIVTGLSFAVAIWGVEQPRSEAVLRSIAYTDASPSVNEGSVQLASIVDPAKYITLEINDWSRLPNPVTALAATPGRWFPRYEGGQNVWCTTTSGSELRLVVEKTPGVGLGIAIPTGMSYRPVVAARWRVFGTLAWSPWVRTAVPDNNSPGDLVRIDPVQGLDPSKRYEVVLCVNVHEDDRHWKYGCGLCVFQVIVAQGGTSAPYIDPLARWLEADGDSITAGVASLPYPPAPHPPSIPANLVSEQSYLHVAADLLGAIPIHNGFGGTGVLVGGSGEIPDARSNIFEYMRGRPRRDARQADVILMNHGTNDFGAAGRNPPINISSAQFRVGYGELLERRAAFSPASALVAMRPFNGAFWTEIRDVARVLGVPTIDTTGWLDPATDYTDGVHPTRDGGHLKGGTRLAPALRDLFGAGYWR